MKSHTIAPPRQPSKAGDLAQAYAALVLGFEPWHWFVTLTTQRAAQEEELAKRYLAFVDAVNRDVLELEPGAHLWAEERLRWVVAWERQRRGAWHLHALWSSPRLARAPYRAVHALWTKRAPEPASGSKGPLIEEEAQGQAWLVSRWAPSRGARRAGLPFACWISPVRSSAATAVHYVTKYVGKGGRIDCDGL